MPRRFGSVCSLVLAVGAALAVGLLAWQVRAAPEPPTASAPSPASKPAPAPRPVALSGSYLQTVRWIHTQARQKCWEPALKARAPGVAAWAIVRMTITTTASGRVQSVKTKVGPQSYPGLAACIEREVRGWRFPRSAAKTVANVPFKFLETPMVPPSKAVGCAGAAPDAFESMGDQGNKAQ